MKLCSVVFFFPLRPLNFLNLSFWSKKARVETLILNILYLKKTFHLGHKMGYSTPAVFCSFIWHNPVFSFPLIQARSAFRKITLWTSRWALRSSWWCWLTTDCRRLTAGSPSTCWTSMTMHRCLNTAATEQLSGRDKFTTPTLCRYTQWHIFYCDYWWDDTVMPFYDLLPLIFSPGVCIWCWQWRKRADWVCNCVW